MLEAAAARRGSLARRIWGWDFGFVRRAQVTQSFGMIFAAIFNQWQA